jgi:ribulose-5-phosphate 4-epimerase/fuculose-1-phosphate aldolase
MSDTTRTRLAQQIAASTRLLVMEGILDYSGHVSARLPGTEHVLIQSASDSRADLDPDKILTVDMDGNVITGEATPPLEVALHLEILRARPDVQAVLHCHMELAIAFTLMKGVQLLPMRARAVRWASGIPTHPDPSLIRTVEQGQALAKTLGVHEAALIRSHGMVLVAESVPGLFVDAIHFLENAQQQMMVLQAGQEPLPLTDEEIAMISGPRDFHIAKLWNFYIRQGRARGIIPQDWSPGV